MAVVTAMQPQPCHVLLTSARTPKLSTRPRTFASPFCHGVLHLRYAVHALQNAHRVLPHVINQQLLNMCLLQSLTQTMFPLRLMHLMLLISPLHLLRLLTHQLPLNCWLVLFVLHKMKS
jgi:hypothetical protein